MRFIVIALSSGLLTGMLLLGAPGPPAGPVAALLALWLFPGYALQAAAMPPGPGGMRWAERLVISVGLSLALLASISVAWDALGNRLNTPAVIWIAYGVTQLASLAGVVAAMRRRERMLPPSCHLPPRSWLLPVVAVGVVVLGGLSVLAWKSPPRADLYVELLILDGQGNAPLVPLRVGSGEAYAFAIRVSSHEASSADYVLRIEGPDRVEPGSARRFVLDRGQSIDVGVVASWVASDDPLTVTLDRNGNAGYRSLRLAVQVGP